MVAWGGSLFKDGRLLTFPANRVGGYSRWLLSRGWALNQSTFAKLAAVFEVLIGALAWCCGEDDPHWLI